MARKSKKSGRSSTVTNEAGSSKEAQQLVETIIQDSLGPDCNIIVLDGKIRDLEEKLGKKLIPFLAKRIRFGKSAEQKVVLDLMVRAKSGEAIEHLHQVAEDQSVSPKVRYQALLQLEEWGETVDRSMLEVFREADQVLDAFENLIVLDNAHDRDQVESVIVQFQQLQPDLRTVLLKQLLDEYPHHVGLVLQFVRDDSDLDEEIITLLAGYETQEVADFIGELLRKETDKSIRRLLKQQSFRLQSKGLSVVAPVPKEEPSRVQAPESLTANGYVSGIDYLGERLVFLSKSVPGWGVVFFQVALSDQDGIKAFTVFDLNRREIKNFIKRVSDTGTIELIEVNPAYCYYLIDEAYQINISKRIAPPEQFSQWRTELRELKQDISEPLIYRQFPRNLFTPDVVRSLRDQYAAIHEKKPFREWFLEPRLVWSYIERCREVRTSPLVLNKYQVEARLESVYSEAVRDIFNDERRRIYKRRLEEMAYILVQAGDENTAKVAVSAALDLEPQALPSDKHQFLCALVTKSIRFYLESEKEGQSDKLLISPR
ncbi:MAG TPA: hypothetical protein PKL48_12425, partial [Thermodesulfobacteriota bacterium]|nr:hypothetical protein [Thermodesulfobacteriota bacterium]